MEPRTALRHVDRRRRRQRRRAFSQASRQRVKLPGVGPRGLAVCGSQVYVAEYFTDSIAAVTLAAGKDATVRSLPLGPKPQWNEVRRGEVLFHDGRICLEGWQSCASCHPEGRADALNWDLLNDGEGNPKNTKSLLLSHRTPPAMASGVRTYGRSGGPLRHQADSDVAAARSRGRGDRRLAQVAGGRCRVPPWWTGGSARRPSGAGGCSRATGSAARSAIRPRSTPI